MNLYLALGDSITAGYGVIRPFSFPALYAAFLRRHNPDLGMINLGVNGLTSGGLVNLLQSNYKLRNSISKASLITITIGSNDLLHLIGNLKQAIKPAQVTYTINTLNKNLALIGKVVRQLNPTATVKEATLYNPLPAGPFAQYSEQAQGIINNANAIISTWANHYGIVIVNLDREFRGNERLFIAPDYGHPNAAGYQVIAKAFARS